jgi:hypothetical protein
MSSKIRTLLALGIRWYIWNEDSMTYFRGRSTRLYGLLQGRWDWDGENNLLPFCSFSMPRYHILASCDLNHITAMQQKTQFTVSKRSCD